MPDRPSDDIDPTILGLLDELDVARSAYDVAVAQGDQRTATRCLERIKEIAARIDQLRFGGGKESKDLTSKFTQH